MSPVRTPVGTFGGSLRPVSVEQLGAHSLRAGHVTRVDTVWLNDEQVILNTASIGAYPMFVRTRVRLQRRISRPLASAVIAVFMVVCLMLIPQRAGRHPGAGRSCAQDGSSGRWRHHA